MNRLELNKFGQYLGIDRFRREFIIYEKKEEKQRIPVEEISQIILTPGNALNTDSLLYASKQGIEVLLCTNSGKPASTLIPIESNKAPDIRIKQYESCNNGKKEKIAREFIRAKLFGQTSVLTKHGLTKPAETLRELTLFLERTKNIDDIRNIEGNASKIYFNVLASLFPKEFAFRGRIKRGAYDPINNLFNLGYSYLSSLCMQDLLAAHLDISLGFLHRNNASHFSLVSDFQEPFRYLIDDFIIGYIPNLKKWDYEPVLDRYRWFLNQPNTFKFLSELDESIQTKVEIHSKTVLRGKKAKIRHILTDQAFNLARYIRGETDTYKISALALS